MKKIIFIILLSLAIPSVAQKYQTPTDSILSFLSKQVDSIEKQLIDNCYSNRYKMYATENIYNLLKLDTATGKIEQVQWSLNENEEGTWTINGINLSNTIVPEPGTFELYPTKNMYQFILLDKLNGRTWHVQWGTGSKKRWIVPIK